MITVKLINVVITSSNFAGNAGGYLGLFLGYALLNVPELIMSFWDWLKGIQRLNQS